MDTTVGPFTKIYMIGILVTSSLTTMKLINPSYFYIIKDIRYIKQIWRYFLSTCFISEFSMGLLFELVFIFTIFNFFETKSINVNKYEDFILMVLFSYFWNMISGLIFTNIFILSKPFFNTILYIFCRKYPHESFNIYLFIKVKAFWFVIFNSLIDIVLYDSNIYVVLFSLLFGHIYLFFKEIYPMKSNKQYLRAPNFLKKIGQIILKLNNYKVVSNTTNYVNDLYQNNQVFQGRGVVNN